MDFDKFLNEASNEVQREAETRQEVARIEQLLDEKLIAYDVPFISAFDNERFLENFNQAYQEHLAETRKLHETTDDSPQQEEYHRKLADALTRVQVATEDYILTRMCMILAIHNQISEEDRITSGCNDLKKHFMAEIIINENISPKHPFYVMADDVLPGESLDLSSDNDNEYFVKALEQHANQQKQQKDSSELRAQAMELLDSVDITDNAKMMAFILTTNLMLDEDMESERAVAQRESKLAEISRDTRIDLTIMNELLNLVIKYHKHS